jgi:branched-chain amino acid transport system ATP-binding protein
MLLDVREVTVQYGKVAAVNGVSLQLMEGDIVTLLGANGAGKTTILKAISGLKNPTSGEIWFSNQRIDKMRPWKIVRLGIGHVPESRRLFRNMTVEDNLLMGAYTQKSGEASKADLEVVYQHFPKIKERRRQKAYSMSGGEQQMLAIGRALMCSPRLLLLDEPSMGLSPVMVEEIASIITKIHKQGTSILMVEQNAAIALNLANRGYVMETGRIVLSGANDDLLKDDRVKRAYLGG